MSSHSMGQILIDNFTVSTAGQLTYGGPSSETDSLTIDGQNASRTLSVSGSSGTVGGQVQSQMLSLAALSSNPYSYSLSYSGFNFDSTSDPILEVDFSGIVGAGQVAVVVQSNTSSSLALLENIPTSTGSTTALYFDLRQASNYTSTSLQQVTSVMIGFTGSTNAFGVSSPEISLQSAAVVPEPSTWALCLAGLIALTVWSQRNSRRMS